MTTLDMFSPASRTTDPATSHIAEHRHTLLKRAERMDQVLKVIMRHPGSTTGELARFMHNEYPDLPIAVAVETPHKRVTDLEDRGLVGRGQTRTCLDTGNLRITWYATELAING